MKPPAVRPGGALAARFGVGGPLLMGLFVGVAGLLSLVLALFGDFLDVGDVGAYAAQRFALLIVMGVLSILSVARYERTSLAAPLSKLKPVLPTLLLCTAFLLLALPYGANGYVWVEPGMYAFFFLSTCLVGLMLVEADAGMAYVRFLFLSIAAVCTVYGLGTINVYLFAVFDGNASFGNHIPYGFVNIRYWSHIATWCLPIIPLAVLIGPLKDVRVWRIVVLLGTGMWWWILFLTMGRGSALGVVFGVTLAVMLFGRRALPWLKVFLMYLAVGFVLWLLLSMAVPSLLSEGEVYFRTVHSGSSGRMPMFIEAWRMSLQNFPFGMGPQSWLTHDVLTETYATSLKFGHPHNMYLMWAAEYGWVLIALLGGVVSQVIRCFWESRVAVLASPATKTSDEKLLMLTAFTASVSAALFHAGVSAVFMAPGSMLVGLFVLIAFWALIGPANPDVSPSTQKRKSPKLQTTVALIVCVVLCIGWLAWLKGVWNYHQDMRDDAVTYVEEVGKATFPRFWLHGNFPR